MSEVERVRQERAKAGRERQAAESERSEERRALLDAATAEIDAKIAAKYDARIADLTSVEALAQRALDDANVAAASDQMASLPQGVIHEWDMLESSRFRRDYALMLTGRRGKFEIVTADTQFAANTRWYQRPPAGSVIVRLLKSDGSPGLKFEKWPVPSYSRKRWEPEGVVPVEETEAT